MLALILAAILGSAVVYFSMQNQIPVTVQLGNYVWLNIPLYLVAVAGLLIGLSMAWLLSAVEGITSTLTIWGKENEVYKLQNLVAKLRQQVRNYELENARLRGGRRETQSALAQERIEHRKDKAKSFLDHLRYRLNT